MARTSVVAAGGSLPDTGEEPHAAAMAPVARRASTRVTQACTIRPRRRTTPLPSHRSRRWAQTTGGPRWSRAGLRFRPGIELPPEPREQRTDLWGLVTRCPSVGRWGTPGPP
jgi:hypothetical protein